MTQRKGGTDPSTQNSPFFDNKTSLTATQMKKYTVHPPNLISAHQSQLFITIQKMTGKLAITID